MKKNIVIDEPPAECAAALGADHISYTAFNSRPSAHWQKHPHFHLGNIVPGVFTHMLAKHTKHLSLVDILSVGVDRMQRNFEPMRKQVEGLRISQLSDEAAKVIIYRAFIQGELEVPRHLARVVHTRYSDPQHEEFAPRTMWSVSNTFTSAFKELDAIPQFRATAKLRAFLEGVHAA